MTGFPLTRASVNLGSGIVAEEIWTPGAVAINYTTFGPSPGGFVEGNFNVTMNFSGVPKNVICHFRVRRP